MLSGDRKNLTLQDARKILALYRLKQSECISTPEMADALEAALTALDGHGYTKDQMREWLK